MTINLCITKHNSTILKLSHSNIRSAGSLLLVILTIIPLVPLLVGGLTFIARPLKIRSQLECERNYVQKINCNLSQVETNLFISNTRIVAITNLKEAKLKTQIYQAFFPKVKQIKNYSIILLQEKSDIPFISGRQIRFDLNDTTRKINKINAFIGDKKQKKMTVYRQNNPLFLQITGIFIIILVLISVIFLVVHLSKSCRIIFSKSTGTITIVNKRIGKLKVQTYHLSRVDSVFNIKFPRNQIKHFKHLKPLASLRNISLQTEIDLEKSKKQSYYLIGLALKSGQYLFLYHSSRAPNFEVSQMNEFLKSSQN